jgi:beta-galactosidase/beta-glucuronidase
MYERDKNETCISIWTIGNENGDGENIKKCVEYLKSRSVKKPVMHTGDNGRDPAISDFRAFGYHNMAALISFPEEGKPVMMLEYGHAMGNSPGLMEDTWDYVYKNRHICGGYVWEFKCHGFYSEDEKGRAFYKYGGDFDDYNHWSNFSMDGYCLSDGTPKPSLRECKNVLAPTYVKLENEKISLMNTNDFKSLDYLTLKWELKEDHLIKKSGEMKLPPIAPYESSYLDLDTNIEDPISGAEYFIDLHFYDEKNQELAFKQVSLGIKKEKEPYIAPNAEVKAEESSDEIVLTTEDAELKIQNGLLSYFKKGDKLLLDEPISFNLYRAPTDNDGIVNWNERWIKEWKKQLYPYFEFIFLGSSTKKLENGGVLVKVKGKWAPISKFTGFNVEIEYTITGDGRVFVDLHCAPYGKFAETIPRLGLVFPLKKEMSEVLWYGRGEDECYVDRKEHCNFGLYRSTVDKMNFLYDIPQECGTRIDTRYLKIGKGADSISFIGSNSFSFSYHDFTLQSLEAARHKNELEKSDKNYLYLDYAMRGIGSKSCGPDPEECYELRAHEFRFAFMIAPDADENELCELSRKSFPSVTEKLGKTHSFDPKTQHVNIVECNRE